MSMEKIKFGVYFEVGKLCKVMVCLFGFVYQCLIFSNCDELLFDDVIWVNQVKCDYFDFVIKMCECGIDVFEMYNLLIEIIQNLEVLKWIFDCKIIVDSVGLGLISELCFWLESLELCKLVEYLIGGVVVDDLFVSEGVNIFKMYCEYLGYFSFLLLLLLNIQFICDIMCWIYGGVILNLMYWLV